MPESPTIPAKSSTRSESASRAARLTALKKRLAREFLDGKSIVDLQIDLTGHGHYEFGGIGKVVQDYIRDGLLMVMHQWAKEEADRIIRLYKIGQGKGAARNANV